eukprot:268650_1
MRSFVLITTYLITSTNCYQIRTDNAPQNLSWTDANTWCLNNFNSTLATINTPQQNQNALQLCTKYSKKLNATGCWIGLHFTNNKWIWNSNNISASFLYWGHQEPNDNRQHCAEMNIIPYLNNDQSVLTGEWNDQFCNGTIDKQLPICNDPPSITHSKINITNNGIYNIFILGGIEAGGGIRKRIYLNAIPSGETVDTWYEDDYTGRQQWILEFIQYDKLNNGIYYISVFDGTPEGKHYLSVSPICCEFTLVNGLLLTDYEQFIFEQHNNWFYIYPKGNIINTSNISLPITNKYLGSPNPSDNNVILSLFIDDGSGRQRWLLEYIGNDAMLQSDIFSDYYLNINLFNWFFANEYCQQHCYSNLASMHNDIDYKYILQLIDNEQYSFSTVFGTWFGLNQISSNENIQTGTGQWLYIDNQTFDYGSFYRHYPWEINQPDGLNAGQRCMRLWKDAENQWDDEFCDVNSMQFVCNTCEWNVLTKYVIIADKIFGNYSAAQIECENTFGTDLASVHSRRDYDEIDLLCYLHALNTDTYNCWIGLYSAAENGEIGP